MSKGNVDFNHIEISSNLSPTMRNEIEEKLSREYKNKTQEISNKITFIIKLIHKVDSLELLNFLSTTDFFSSLMMGSEIDYEEDQILQNRTIEYIQSLLVSKVFNSNKIMVDKGNQEFLFYEIQTKTMDLYRDIQDWYYYWSAYAEKVLNLESAEISYIIESQLFSWVRGKRYQFQMEEDLTTLINPLDQVLKDKYNISSKDVVNGLVSIENSYTRGKGEAIDEIQNLVQNSEVDFNNMDQEAIEKGQSLFEKVFGTKLNDIKEITDWPESFISDLSLLLGESIDFQHIEYSYWPILSLPIQRKPFIKIENKYYCFSYYNLSDNIYRSLQKILSSSSQFDKNVWEQNQKEYSEDAIASIFNKLLPGCKIYRDNYYPEKESLRRMNENDIIIEFENSLFIIEVKAGSFSPSAALVDYESHIRSYKNLVEKADQQCQRTLAYLKRKEHSPIYDKEKKLKTEISLNSYDYIYSFCVTIDDFNEFAAKAEKLNQININIGTIVISINDLRTYKDYFDSPFIFLNFLENRKNATQVESLRLTDELDHLGMYIKHNMYPLTFRNVKKNSTVQGWGYRQELDEYFMSLWSGKIVEKPVRELDSIRTKLLSILNRKKIENKLIFSNFLLDFSTEGAQNFEKSISHLGKRQLELNRMVPAISAGEDIRYVLYLEQPNVEKVTIEQMREYCDGMLAYGKYSDILMIRLIANSELSLIDLEFENRKRASIKPEEMNKLIERGKESYKSKKISILKAQGKKKIGRNDQCPCGSGLKYKKCCGK